MGRLLTAYFLVLGNREEEKEKRKKTEIRAERKAKRARAAFLFEFTNICPFKHAKNSFLCLYCDASYTGAQELKHHNIENHKDLDGKHIADAILCYGAYGDESIKADITDIQCKLCEAPAESIEQVKLHLIRHHNKKIKLNCDNGIVPFKLMGNEYKCAICNVIFEDYKSLTTHMNVHFTNHVCDVCGQGFMTDSRLKTHQVRHDLGSVPCNICGKIFQSLILKTEHYYRVHKNATKHQCPECPDTFKHYLQKLNHLTAVHGVKTREYKCEYCPKVFNLCSKRSIHTKSVHLNIKRFTCEYCDKQFYHTNELKNHMLTHTGEKNHACQVCNRTFARRNTLRQHMRLHDTRLRYNCSFCEKTFAQRVCLRNHLARYHPNTIKN